GVLQAVGGDFLFGYEVSETTIIPVKILLNQNFTFGDCSKSSSYKIISLPGDINIPAQELLAGAGEHKKDWNIYYDNGKTSNYLMEYSTASGFSFQPGKAYWALSRMPFSISRQVNAVPTASEGWFSIPLHEGWNLIADPFDTEITWGAVRLANGLGNNENIYAWNGAWSNPSTMKPYEGYYYYNANNLPSLIAPMMSRLQKSADGGATGAGYILKAYLLQDGKEYSPVFAAVNAASKQGYDIADLFAPPSDFAELSLFIRNDMLETDYKNLFTDARASVEQGQEYSLICKNKTGSTAELQLDALQLPAGMEACIYDEKTGKRYSSLTLNPYPQTKELLLFIGSSNYIAEKAINKVPSEYALQQNFPNPFNSSTVIQYGLPVKSQIEITVYDALGQRAVTLYDGLQDAGYHEVLFDASRFSSGIYYCTLRTQGYMNTKKLILLK
ncbi:MAG: T9SS type A sorting domain-containing protein, partial [Syntrophothermus sp.]